MIVQLATLIKPQVNNFFWALTEQAPTKQVTAVVNSPSPGERRGQKEKKTFW